MASWQMAPPCRYIAETWESPSVSLAPLLSRPKKYYNHFLINVLNCLPHKTLTRSLVLPESAHVPLTVAEQTLMTLLTGLSLDL